MGTGGGHDPFSSFFGDFGFSFFGEKHSHEEETPRGADIYVDLLVSLEEVNFSASVIIGTFLLGL